VASSEFGGVRLRRTAGSRHLEDDECGQGAAGTGETLNEIGRKGRAVLARIFESCQIK